jgi:uncharacterized membrane protein
MLLPSFIQQSAAINMDWLTNSISLLFIAYVLKLKYQKEKISLSSIIYLIIMELILAFCKFGFFPIAFLILLIPSKKFDDIKINPIVTKILLITFVIMISYINNSSLGGAVSSGSSSSNYYTIKYAISHPVNTMYVYANTLLNRLDIDIFRGQFDSYGIYTKTNRSLFTAILIIMYAILFLSYDENNELLSKKERIVCLCTSAIMIVIPYTAMFLCWTVIGSNSIDGLQPRYFLIAELLLFIGLSNNLLKLNIKNKNKVYAGCIIFNYCISLFTIIIGFY